MSRCQPEQPPRTHHVCQLHTAHFVRARTDIKVGEGWRAGVVGPPIWGAGDRPGVSAAIGLSADTSARIADHERRGVGRRPRPARAACAALPPLRAFHACDSDCLGEAWRGARGGGTGYRLRGAEAEPYRRINMHACEYTNTVEFRQPKTTEEALGLRTPPCNPMRSGGAQPAAYPPAACCCCCCPPPDRPLP